MSPAVVLVGCTLSLRQGGASTVIAQSVLATCYSLDGPRIESRWGARFSAPVQTVLGTHPASRGGKGAGAWG